MRAPHHAAQQHPQATPRHGALRQGGARSRVGRLPRWQRITSHVVFGLCALSGLAYLLKHELGWPELDFSARPLLISHGISAALALMAFGAVLPVHIRATWHARRNIGSGIAMLIVMTALALTGLGLYYGSEEQHELFLWSHWLVGATACLALPAHLLLGARAGDPRPSPTAKSQDLELLIRSAN